MYDTLRPELITATRKQRKAMTRDPTEVVCFHLFQENQFPYLEVCHLYIHIDIDIYLTAASLLVATVSIIFYCFVFDLFATGASPIYCWDCCKKVESYFVPLFSCCSSWEENAEAGLYSKYWRPRLSDRYVINHSRHIYILCCWDEE